MKGNSVAVASFKPIASQLAIISEVVVQQYNENPLNFLIADYVSNFLFEYQHDEQPLLQSYIHSDGSNLPVEWLSVIWQVQEPVQAYALLKRLNTHIHYSLTCQRREEQGVQAPEVTLRFGAGSCRYFATLFIAAARGLGLAARFVRGYFYAQTAAFNIGSTHVWAEVYLPGAGWKRFDPAIGSIVGIDHIAVAVATSPEKVPPVSSIFIGPSRIDLDVGAWVAKL